MKEKCLIFYGNPCLIPLGDPAIQTFEEAQKGGPKPCRFYYQRSACSPPHRGCVQLSGLKMARYVLQFYSEATEQTLAMEKEQFRARAPLPLLQVEGYIDTPEYGHRLIADPELVVQRVWEFARAVLALKPGERIFRSPEETWTAPLPVAEEIPVTKGKKEEGPESAGSPALASRR